MRIIKYLIILSSCLIISCSLVKTAYNKAPELAIWWLNDYFNFTAEQKTALNPLLQKLHSWHRQTQLPIYQTLLQELQTSFGNEQISALQACEKIDAVRQSIRTIQIETIPIIVEMAPLLSDKQLAYFKKKLEKRTEKWKDEWWPQTQAEQIKVRQEKTEDFAEDVYGDLNDAQLNQLKQSVTYKNIKPELSYAEIQRRNEDSFNILSAVQNPLLTSDEKTQMVKTGFDRLQKSPNQAYQTYADELTKHTCETIANLHATTSAKQKLHAKNWLQDYIKQITALQEK